MYGAGHAEAELLTDAAPAKCAEMLAHGAVEAALVPIVEYQRLPDLVVVPGVCIGARRAVRSVVLATRHADLRAIRSVALDESSRTSAALVQVIFREFYGRALVTAQRAPDLNAMLDAHDAALLIGDPAMMFPRSGLYVHDLATLWREHTGLGFVFAMWMARADSAQTASKIDFARARAEGLRRIAEIVARYEPELNLPAAELFSYLRDNLCFELNEEMRAGLALFYQLAHKHELTPAARPLRLLTDAVAA